MNLDSLEIIISYLGEVGTVLTRLPVKDIELVVKILAAARNQGKRVYIFGNGGSAATASHFACDLAKGAIRPEKPRFKAFALTDGIPLVSAWANDSAYENIFAEQLENYIEAGDVAIAISGSGNSPNVLKGISVAKAKGATTIGLTAFDGGKLKLLVDVPLVVPVHNMEQAEDIHLVLEHVIVVCLRQAFNT
jgi:D-sedoheptulose 7-phosphate isomerase